MPDNKQVTARECELIHEHVTDKLEQILAGVTELKELKEVLNPAFATYKQKMDEHLERHKTKWSMWQITLTAILALGTIGMFVVALYTLSN